MLQRAKPCFDSEVTAILARLRRSRIVCCDETTVRINGRNHWNWVFQNDQVVIHVVRNTRAASVVTETMAGHRPRIWVSHLYGAHQGQGHLVAGRCVGAAAPEADREHAAQLSAQAGSRVERDHGVGTDQPPWQAAAKTLR